MNVQEGLAYMNIQIPILVPQSQNKLVMVSWARYGCRVNKALCLCWFWKQSFLFLLVSVGFVNKAVCLNWLLLAKLFVFVRFVNQAVCFCLFMLVF